ncbi:hypothetical protein H4Q26_015240 [Puccinia striiformis f. sp. tritici PST-130]|nr:hypothetical protein H4Q26_015240 [Puccinia striiformis f. sp. tritici PST-130]
MPSLEIAGLADRRYQGLTVTGARGQLAPIEWTKNYVLRVNHVLSTTLTATVTSQGIGTPLEYHYPSKLEGRPDVSEHRFIIPQTPSHSLLCTHQRENDVFGFKNSNRSLFLLCLLPFVILDDARTQVIYSPKGSIRGAESQTKDVFKYSLRYAQPPVGQLRWRDPLPVNRWNGIFDATNTPPLCPQRNIPSTQSISEDCLLHGGSFIQGGSTNYGLDGAALAGKSKMIVVVVQYRLGLLGFLKGSLARTFPSISGNYGLKDVIAALNSIKEFADTFGGDQNRITLAGQSSGAELIKTLL